MKINYPLFILNQNYNQNYRVSLKGIITTKEAERQQWLLTSNLKNFTNDQTKKIAEGKMC